MKPRVLAALMIGVGALVVWVSSRMNWITVEAFDDKSGSSTQSIVGAVWSTEIMALALVLAAACVAGLVLRSLGRRIIGVISAVVAIAASLSPLALLTGEATAEDAERARTLLTSGAASQQANSGTLLSEWAGITDVSNHPLAAVVALIGCALALFGGVLLAMRPGTDPAQASRYERRQARAEKIRTDLETAPDSGRVMWDALDEDIDPTDTSGGSGKSTGQS